jgi:hypothetical protein
MRAELPIESPARSHASSADWQSIEAAGVNPMTTTDNSNSEVPGRFTSGVPDDQPETLDNRAEKKVEDVANKAAHKAAKTQQEYDEVNSKPFTN